MECVHGRATVQRPRLVTCVIEQGIRDHTEAGRTQAGYGKARRWEQREPDPRGSKPGEAVIMPQDDAHE
jgi:hypothetical protein